MHKILIYLHIMYYMEINKNFVHQVGDQTRLYYDARSTNHQDVELCYTRAQQQWDYVTGVISAR